MHKAGGTTFRTSVTVPQRKLFGSALPAPGDHIWEIASPINRTAVAIDIPFRKRRTDHIWDDCTARCTFWWLIKIAYTYRYVWSFWKAAPMIFIGG